MRIIALILILMAFYTDVSSEQSRSTGESGYKSESNYWTRSEGRGI